MLYEIIPVYGSSSGGGGSARKDTEGAVEHAAGGIGISGYVYGCELGEVPRVGDVQLDPGCGQRVRALDPPVEVVAQDEGCLFCLIHVRIAVVFAFAEQVIVLFELIILHGLRDQHEEQCRPDAAAVL